MSESEYQDCDIANFDPLDLGWEADEDECRPRRGRPKNSILDLARASYWAWEVQKAARKPFAVLERELAHKQFRRRDGGGYAQPNAWLKYAKGKRCPTPPDKGNLSQVVQAEMHYPGTRATYDSIVWDLMYDAKSIPKKRLRLTSRISPLVLSWIDSEHIEEKDQYRLLLTEEGLKKIVRIKHLDAFGLLLMQWRNLDWERANPLFVYVTRMWLLNAFQWMEPLITCRRLMAKLIHHNVRELGLLYGLHGLDPKKSPEECADDAFLAVHLATATVPKRY